MKIAKDGLKFILPAAALAGLFWAFVWPPLGVFFLVAAAAFAFFFRDPRRVPPEGENRLVSPADGRVLAVETLPSSAGPGGRSSRVTVFLSLFDVHLVRSPLAAAVGPVEYRPGKFLPAYRPEAGTANESNTLVLRGGKAAVVMKMIVGVAARRIKCFVREGETVARGQKVGLMYFGSRVEITLPSNVRVTAARGQRVRAGETVIAEVEP